jgi:hypothetical protein
VYEKTLRVNYAQVISERKMFPSELKGNVLKKSFRKFGKFWEITLTTVDFNVPSCPKRSRNKKN